MDIREAEVEDVFVNSPSLTASLLHLAGDPRPLFRQMPLPSGRLDILFAYQARLLLIELKVVGFHAKFLEQVKNYVQDLARLQCEGQRPYNGGKRKRHTLFWWLHRKRTGEVLVQHQEGGAS